MKLTLFWRKVIATLLSITLLSSGWLGSTGITLLVALVPLLWISGMAEDSRRGWWSLFGWALFTFVGWNLSTIWWIGLATPVGPFAATLASSFNSMLAFMLFHSVSKKAPKALAYTLLVSAWIAIEYNYTTSDFSWPWLLLGNGFSNNIWAIQWYEYTGIFGGSLWVLLSNIFIYEAYVTGRGSRRSAILVAVVPITLSLIIYFTYDPYLNEEGDVAETIQVSIIQPNIDCYDKFSGNDSHQESILLDLLGDVPSTTDLILMPETAIPRHYITSRLNRASIIKELQKSLERNAPNARLVSGANTIKIYNNEESRSETARKSATGDQYHDIFNSAIITSATRLEAMRHKSRLVIGVENTPTWIFDIFNFFVIDIGGVVGQIGKGGEATAFNLGEHKIGAAICYEGLYGDFYGGFVRDGAEMISIISNDGWWGDTPGHRHLYSFSSIRAVEHRRAIARSANTGTSGFINSRGDSIESLGWDKRGVLTHDVSLHQKKTIYTLWGDYIARIAVLVAALSLLYYISYRARRRHHLV